MKITVWISLGVSVAIGLAGALLYVSLSKRTPVANYIASAPPAPMPSSTDHSVTTFRSDNTDHQEFPQQSTPTPPDVSASPGTHTVKRAHIEFPSASGVRQDLSARMLRELADLTPRPFFEGCLNDLETFCPYERTFLTEQIDPDWSVVTEKRLRELWNEYLPELSGDFLFAKCKTTLCQVNYRFPLEAGGNGIPPPIGAFIDGFRKSNLSSELRRAPTIYTGGVVSTQFTRILSQEER